MIDSTAQAYEFILYCYFGDMSNPIEAAIDRAYIDMASHTLRGFAGEDYKRKWALRYAASEKIKEMLEKISEDFDEWHKETCRMIQKTYEDKKIDFSYGQAQKWINMTTKYLYVFSLVFADRKDKRLTAIPEFIINHHEKLHIPIDNFILLEQGLVKYRPWSRMDEDTYNKCRSDLEGKDIDWELENWNNASYVQKANDISSYARYKFDKKNCNNCGV